MSAKSERRVALNSLVVASSLLGGCVQPPCEETYSPLVKILVGAPIPVALTLVCGFGVMRAIEHLLVREECVRGDALLTLGLTCAGPWTLMLTISPSPGLLFVLWVLGWIGTMVLALRNRGQNPNHASWTHALSDTLEPSLASRLAVVVLIFLLTLITLIGTVATSMAINSAGQRCGYDLEESQPRPPAES